MGRDQQANGVGGCPPKVKATQEAGPAVARTMVGKKIYMPEGTTWIQGSEEKGRVISNYFQTPTICPNGYATMGPHNADPTRSPFPASGPQH